MNRRLYSVIPMMLLVCLLFTPALIFAAPTLTSISPTSIKPGIQMTLTGSSFGTVPDAVIFNVGNGHSVEVASFVSWSDTQIVLVVPNGVAPGTVWVDQAGAQSNALSFTTIAPTLNTIAPTNIKPGMQMTLTGSGFGSVADAVIFDVGNGHSVEVASFISWTDTQIVLTVPQGVAPGTVWVDQNGDQSNALSFTTIAPTLTSITPTNIKPGIQMTLTGSGFGTVADAVIFDVGNGHSVEVASFISWTDTQIVLTVPNGVAPGTVWVDQFGDQSNALSFTTIAPTLTSISPTNIKPGIQMTLTGSGFGTQADAIVLSFPNSGHYIEVASFISWSDTQIVFTVPNGLEQPAKVYVLQNGDQSNAIAFTTIAPTLTSISPTSVKPGMQMTLTGSGFGTQADAIVLSFPNSGHYIEVASFISWSDTQIVFTVPNGLEQPANVYVLQNGDQSNSVAFTTIAPALSSISPTSIQPGVQMTLTGSGFGTVADAVIFNVGNGHSVEVASFTSWTDTQIVLTVPNGIAPGTVWVDQNGDQSNALSFNTIAPTLTSISPTSIQPGTQMTLAGNNFGTAADAVVFGGLETTSFVSWTNTQIVLKAPQGVSSGSVYVDQNGMQSNSIAYTVIVPHISSLSPTSGGTGTVVTITGTNFGSTQGSSTVTFNGTLATPQSWGATSIVVPVPGGATTGPVMVTVDTERSNSVNFTDTSAPTISSLSPSSGKAGIAVTITGLGFGTTKGTSTVTFNGATAATTSWSTTQIVATTPTGVTTGNVLVTVGGVASNGVLFTAAPIISSLSPTSGPVGGIVTITGTSFGTLQAGSTVTFNGKAATVSSWSATQIIATVPSGATSGPVVVTTDGMASNGVTFTVTAAPVISSISPTSGPVGITITITGTNFGASQGTSTVTLNGTPMTPTSWSATSIKVTVPTGATTGPLVVTVDGVASNGITFTVLPTPTITSLQPSTGIIGTVVAITGTNFGTTQGSSTVTFNGKPGIPQSWSSTQILVPVPTGATTGPVVVTVNGVASNGVTFTVSSAPTILSVSPNSGAVGTPVTITGANFGSTRGSSTVKFNGTSGTPTSWAAGQIVVPVPSGATSGNIVVTVGGVASNGVAFTVLPTPNITSLSPSSGPVGASVSINGTNFGSSQGTSIVTFSGIPAGITGWASTQIVAIVPGGATTGPVVVVVNGVSSNGVTFTVLPAPTITSVVPGQGAIGASITIGGTNFGATKGNSTITFNGVAGTPASWSSTQIIVPVPASATSGSIVVTVGGIASNSVNFIVLAVPSISSLSPTSGPQGTSVTITGTNFGSSQNTSSVTFNGTIASPTSWTNTQIVVPVPGGASTGNVVVTVNGVSSNGVLFTVTGPVITSISPTSGPIGTSVTINGNNFGSTQGSSTVTFNGIQAIPTSWSATKIVAQVPNGASTGNVVVTVNGVSTTGTFQFQVTNPGPSITSLSPTSGPILTPVTITGTNFGAAQGNSTVTFNGVQGAPSTWSNTSIVVPVPVTANTGNVIVTVNGVASNPVVFTVTASITGLSLPQGPPLLGLVITGINFGTTQGTVALVSGGTSIPLTVLAGGWSGTQITVQIPAGTANGNYNLVVTAGGNTSNSVPFSVVSSFTCH